MPQQCPQCGLFHPPLGSGEKCPLAPDKTKNGDVIDYDKFLRSLKDVLSSQIKTKNIVDHQKIFGLVIVNITKFLEEYREE